MGTRRANNEGGICKRKDGYFQASATIHLPDGSVKRKYHYGKTKRECKEWLNNILELDRTGRYALSEDIPLIYWLREWNDKYTINIRHSTADSYTAYIERHIAKSNIANIPLSKLNTSCLQDYVLYLMEHGRLDGKGGLSPKTVKNLLNMLHKALKQAVGNQLIKINPADYVQLPKIERKEVEILTIDEMKRLLEAAKGERWYAPLAIQMLLGVRLGELTALQWKDFKLSDNVYYVSIRHSLQRVSNPNYDKTSKSGTNSKKTILQIGDTKSVKGHRDIPLLPHLIPIIESHYWEQEERLKLIGVDNQKAFFVDNGFGEYTDPATYRKWFKEIAHKSGIDRNVYPHLTRHGFCSLALKNDIDMKHISDLMGHSDLQTSAIYQHTDIKSRSDEMMKLMDIADKIL